MDIDIREIKIRDLRPNNGEVEGLPRNPRKISKKNLEKLKKSLQDAPEMLRLRELIVVPHNSEFVVIAGNQRLEAAKEVGMTALPCKVLPADTDPAKLREYAIKDNLPFGEDDWEVIARDWDTAELEEWGMAVPEEWQSFDKEHYDDLPNGKDGEKIEEVEKLLDEAMRENITEYRRQVDITIKNGFLASGLTRGCAKACFIRALHYGDRYPQKMAYVYAPELYFLKNANNSSYPDAMDRIINGKNAGIAGFRTLTSDYMLTKTIASSYRVGVGGGGGDFPSSLAKDMIGKYSNGGRVLDPCHGWGGRMIGAMLAGAREYVGFDPSPIAHRAVTDIYTDFGVYVDMKATLVQLPFENAVDEYGRFDMAITSPPYFDVEKYEGEDTSTKLYPYFDLWCEKFYSTLITKTIAMLKDGGVFILQVGSQKYPLKDKALDICAKNRLKATIIGEDIFKSNLGKEDGSNKECLIRIDKNAK